MLAGAAKTETSSLPAAQSTGLQDARAAPGNGGTGATAAGSNSGGQRRARGRAHRIAGRARRSWHGGLAARSWPGPADCRARAPLLAWGAGGALVAGPIGLQGARTAPGMGGWRRARGWIRQLEAGLEAGPTNRPRVGGGRRPREDTDVGLEREHRKEEATTGL